MTILLIISYLLLQITTAATNLLCDSSMWTPIPAPYSQDKSACTVSGKPNDMTVYSAGADFDVSRLMSDAANYPIEMSITGTATNGVARFQILHCFPNMCWGVTQTMTENVPKTIKYVWDSPTAGSYKVYIDGVHRSTYSVSTGSFDKVIKMGFRIYKDSSGTTANTVFTLSDATINPPIPPAVTTKGPRDCSVLDIDDFLVQCSAEFSAQESEIGQLATDLADAVSDIAQNKADIAKLSTDMSSNIATELATVQNDIDTINARFDLFAAKAVAGALDASNNANASMIGLQMKDLIIIILLMVNLIAMCFIYFGKMRKGQRKQYAMPYDEECDVAEHEPIKE